MGEDLIAGGVRIPKYIGWGVVLGALINIIYMATTYGHLSERFINMQQDIKEIKIGVARNSDKMSKLSEELIILKVENGRSTKYSR